jgi:type II secretory pathway pseudopilin PulG
MRRNGTTLVELVVALAIMATVFAAIVPLFAGIRHSDETHWATFEVLQQARVLDTFLRRRLATARRILDVSRPHDDRGYIEFETADGTVQRVAVHPDGWVKVGSGGELHELAGPVEHLRFACFKAGDPASPALTSSAIRLVTWKTRFQAAIEWMEAPRVEGACWLRIDPPIDSPDASETNS